jgi:ABC-type Fe3+-hydroxamate transport system substrate-binding protein
MLTAGGVKAEQLLKYMEDNIEKVKARTFRQG